MDSINTMSSLVVTPPSYRNLARALVARSLGRRPFLFLLCVNRVLLARGKSTSATLSYALWPQRTLFTVSSQSLCHVFLNIRQRKNCVRFGRLTYDMEEYRLENVFQLLNDTVRHLVFIAREHEDVMVIMELLNGTGFNAQSRTPDKQQFRLVLVEIDTERSRLACRKHSLINCTHIATATRTSVATIQQSASTQNPSCESLE